MLPTSRQIAETAKAKKILEGIQNALSDLSLTGDQSDWMKLKTAVSNSNNSILTAYIKQFNQDIYAGCGLRLMDDSWSTSEPSSVKTELEKIERELNARFINQLNNKPTLIFNSKTCYLIDSQRRFFRLSSELQFSETTFRQLKEVMKSEQVDGSYHSSSVPIIDALTAFFKMNLLALHSTGFDFSGIGEGNKTFLHIAAISKNNVELTRFFYEDLKVSSNHTKPEPILELARCQMEVLKLFRCRLYSTSDSMTPRSISKLFLNDDAIVKAGNQIYYANANNHSCKKLQISKTKISSDDVLSIPEDQLEQYNELNTLLENLDQYVGLLKISSTDSNIDHVKNSVKYQSMLEVLILQQIEADRYTLLYLVNDGSDTPEVSLTQLAIEDPKLAKRLQNLQSAVEHLLKDSPGDTIKFRHYGEIITSCNYPNFVDDFSFLTKNKIDKPRVISRWAFGEEYQLISMLTKEHHQNVYLASDKDKTIPSKRTNGLMVSLARVNQIVSIIENNTASYYGSNATPIHIAISLGHDDLMFKYLNRHVIPIYHKMPDYNSIGTIIKNNQICFIYDEDRYFVGFYHMCGHYDQIAIDNQTLIEFIQDKVQKQQNHIDFTLQDKKILAIAYRLIIAGGGCDLLPSLNDSILLAEYDYSTGANTLKLTPLMMCLLMENHDQKRTQYMNHLMRYLDPRMRNSDGNSLYDLMVYLDKGDWVTPWLIPKPNSTLPNHSAFINGFDDPGKYSRYDFNGNPPILNMLFNSLPAPGNEASELNKRNRINMQLILRRMENPYSIVNALGANILFSMIELDDSEMLNQLFKFKKPFPFASMFIGDTLVDHCVKANALKCINWLKMNDPNFKQAMSPEKYLFFYFIKTKEMAEFLLVSCDDSQLRCYLDPEIKDTIAHRILSVPGGYSLIEDYQLFYHYPDEIDLMTTQLTTIGKTPVDIFIDTACVFDPDANQNPRVILPQIPSEEKFLFLKYTFTSLEQRPNHDLDCFFYAKELIEFGLINHLIDDKQRLLQKKKPILELMIKVFITDVTNLNSSHLQQFKFLVQQHDLLKKYQHLLVENKLPHFIEKLLCEAPLLENEQTKITSNLPATTKSKSALQEERIARLREKKLKKNQAHLQMEASNSLIQLVHQQLNINLDNIGRHKLSLIMLAAKAGNSSLVDWYLSHKTPQQIDQSILKTYNKGDSALNYTLLKTSDFSMVHKLWQKLSWSGRKTFMTMHHTHESMLKILAEHAYFGTVNQEFLDHLQSLGVVYRHLSLSEIYYQGEKEADSGANLNPEDITWDYLMDQSGNSAQIIMIKQLRNPIFSESLSTLFTDEVHDPLILMRNIVKLTQESKRCSIWTIWITIEAYVTALKPKIGEIILELMNEQRYDMAQALIKRVLWLQNSNETLENFNLHAPSILLKSLQQPGFLATLLKQSYFSQLAANEDFMLAALSAENKSAFRTLMELDTVKVSLSAEGKAKQWLMRLLEAGQYDDINILLALRDLKITAVDAISLLQLAIQLDSLESAQIFLNSPLFQTVLQENQFAVLKDAPLGQEQEAILDLLKANSWWQKNYLLSETPLTSGNDSNKISSEDENEDNEEAEFDLVTVESDNSVKEASGLLDFLNRTFTSSELQAVMQEFIENQDTLGFQRCLNKCKTLRTGELKKLAFSAVTYGNFSIFLNLINRAQICTKSSDFFYNQLICHALDVGQFDMADTLLIRREVCPPKSEEHFSINYRNMSDNAILRNAIKCHKFYFLNRQKIPILQKIIDFMLEDTTVQQNCHCHDNVILRRVVQAGDILLAQRLLQLPNVKAELAVFHHNPLRSAVRNGARDRYQMSYLILQSIPELQYAIAQSLWYQQRDCFDPYAKALHGFNDFLTIHKEVYPPDFIGACLYLMKQYFDGLKAIYPQEQMSLPPPSARQNYYGFFQNNTPTVLHHVYGVQVVSFCVPCFPGFQPIVDVTLLPLNSTISVQGTEVEESLSKETEKSGQSSTFSC